jgi:hypothetical protein
VVLLEAEGRKGRVARTLLVGDEPRDIVFAGPGASRAFITAAHRGQNLPCDPQITTPGVGRADVWVFDADHLGDSLAGSPLTILTLFTDTPRALAVSPDGARVYAAGFHTGNRTTTINEQAVPDGGEAAGGLPGPNMNFEGIPEPDSGLIVKFDGAHWHDELGRSWDTKVKFSLPDRDVFAIDAMSSPPVAVGGPQGSFSGIGTILFNMAVNPVSGKVYVSNTEALNERRFEGPGIFAGHSVRGHLHESRITVLGPSGVSPRHLNKHIDYGTCCAPTPNAESDKSLAFPQELAVTRDGATLYAAALGSSRIGGLQHRGARERHLRAQRREPDSGERRRTDGRRAERQRQTPLRAHPLRQRNLGHRYEAPRGDGPHGDAQPRAAEHHRGPAIPL